MLYSFDDVDQALMKYAKIRKLARRATVVSTEEIKEDEAATHGS